ncbi:hypothetical protein CCACVL1_00045, partial [Corchorus capsularis]
GKVDSFVLGEINAKEKMRGAGGVPNLEEIYIFGN